MSDDLIVCTHCSLPKSRDQFWFNKAKNHLSRTCRQCTTEQARERRERDPEKAKERNAVACRRYRDNHPKRVQEIARAHRLNNRDKVVAKEKVYRQKNREKINAQCVARRKANPVARFVHSIRANLGKRITRRKGEKSDHTFELVGCTVTELRSRLESLWQPGMSWDNYGQWRLGEPMTWHVDHIKPCAFFDLTDPEQQRACFHWTNLQPLWAIDNLSKNDKVSEEDL